MSKADRHMKACGKEQKRPTKFDSPFGPRTSGSKRVSINGKKR